MKQAILYDKLPKNRAVCNVCEHHCNISENQRGICGTRQNIKGDLYSLVYGNIIAKHADPIEKKPLFHFLPGSSTYSYATVGCNFHCDNCHNWQISQYTKENNDHPGNKISPEEIVVSAIKNNCTSISATYTEPTIFLEYALSVMKLAKKKGLKNIWVSNGYMSQKTIKLIIPYLDAINIDLKFFDDENYKKNCGAHLLPILNNLITFKKKNIWLEITTLAIPGLSDTKKMFTKIAHFIKNELGSETPWHISGFSPEISYKLQDYLPTSLTTIQNAVNIGLTSGLKYVYGGNTIDAKIENTYCPNCHQLVVSRKNYETKIFFKNNQCFKCKNKLDFIL